MVIVTDQCSLSGRHCSVNNITALNSHTPYPDTRELALFREDKAVCCQVIGERGLDLTEPGADF